MSELYRVTITGADDSVQPSNLAELSAEYPFVEWGILVSRRAGRAGKDRFPSPEWMASLAQIAERYEEHNIKLSMHVCGAWVRQLFVNELNWNDIPPLLRWCHRVQINTHGERTASTMKYLVSLTHIKDKQIIFQFDDVNNHLIWPAKQDGLNVAALYDVSGGAGMLPERWPYQCELFPMGYAGGLGPENIVTEIQKINTVCTRPFWIDMERNVRTPDDSALDLDKVRKVLKKAAPFVRADFQDAPL